MIYILLSFVLAQASATPAPDGPAAPATVRGRVTDKQTGAPITGAIVRLGKMNPNDTLYLYYTVPHGTVITRIKIGAGSQDASLTAP